MNHTINEYGLQGHSHEFFKFHITNFIVFSALKLHLL